MGGRKKKGHTRCRMYCSLILLKGSSQSILYNFSAKKQNLTLQKYSAKKVALTQEQLQKSNIYKLNIVHGPCTYAQPP